MKGEENIGKNIRTEMAHGKSHDQAMAIAMSVAGKKKKKKKVGHMGSVSMSDVKKISSS